MATYSYVLTSIITSKMDKRNFVKWCNHLHNIFLGSPNKSIILKWPLIPNFFFKISFSTAINPENIDKLFIFCFFNQVVFSRNLKIQLQPTCCRVSVVHQIICILTMVMEVHCCFLGRGIAPWWKIKYNSKNLELPNSFRNGRRKFFATAVVLRKQCNFTCITVIVPLYYMQMIWQNVSIIKYYLYK